MKTCRKCQSEFDSTRCPSCAKEYNKKWRVNNSTKEKARLSARYITNSDKIKAVSAKWYSENIDRAKAARDKYRAANSARLQNASAKWKSENPGAIRSQSHNRRSRERNSGARLSKDIVPFLMEKQMGKCACCGLPLGDDYHLDHIMPLALGGENVDANMQLLRKRCNLQKSAKHPVKFMQERGFLL